MPTLDEALTTTRTVRRRLDFTRPVDRELAQQCLRLAVHAPNGSNRQDWRFLLVDDGHTKEAIARHYRRAFEIYLAGRAPTGAIADSARHLAEHLHEVPLLVLACMAGRLRDDDPPARRSSFYGSVYPAIWSFMLAARGRGLGTALTTVHLRFEREVAQLLDIPFEHVTQVAMIAVGHTTGSDLGPAARRPLADVVHWNRWPAATT